MKKEKNIKDLLKELFLLTKKEVFTDASLADGSTIRTDDSEFKVGSKVSLVGADGTVTPVVDGDYTLTDGSKLTCKSGVIESIIPASPDASAPMADDATGVMDAVPAPVDGMVPVQDADQPAPSAPAADGDDIASLVEIIKNLTDRISAIEEKVSSTKMAVEKMSAAPAAKPINSSVTGKGTVGDYLTEFKKEYAAKQKRNLDNVLKMSANKKVDAPMVFTKANAAPVAKTKIELPFGGFNISNG